tara:strand:- start:314 stop:1354 length:1041 start_codon:yes stop_codon:yes gene_type:complete
VKPVNFAILGCGKIGVRHAEKLQKVKGASLVAVCDSAKERADELAKKYNIKAYYDIKDLMKDPKVDFVNVCTPSGFHPDHSIQSLDAGKNVLCEKPMAFREADAHNMMEVAKKNNKMLFVVKQNRHNPPVKLVSKLLQEGKFGKPIKCVVNVFWNRNEDYYKSEKWRGTLEMDGGTLCSQASHFVDLMLAFFGEPKSVYALMDTKKQKIEAEDTGVIAIEFANGACGSFNYTTCVTHKNIEGSILLIGTEGTVKIGGEYLNTIEQFQVNGMDSYELEKSNAGPNDYGTYKGSMSNHDKVFEAIVAKVRGEDKHNGTLISGKPAIATVRFIEKTIESAKTGQKIYFV